jgi:hypothetical protein
MRAARAGGRLETRFFGAVPVLGESAPAAAPWWAGERHALRLVPRHAPEGTAGRHGEEGHDLRNYADEIIWMLRFVARVEEGDDRDLGATRPSVPDAHDSRGHYPLRPDGKFDLSDARIEAVQDHPLHGWPTSDGHLALNGCTYGFLQLDPAESRLHRGRADAPAEQAGEVGLPQSAASYRWLSFAERTGEPRFVLAAERVLTTIRLLAFRAAAWSLLPFAGWHWLGRVLSGGRTSLVWRPGLPVRVSLHLGQLFHVMPASLFT